LLAGGRADISGVRRRAALLLVAILVAGCVKRARPEVAPPPAPPVAGAAVVAVARSFVGTPYRNGGAAPGGFDCSGFTRYVFAQVGVALPRSAPEQAAFGAPIERGDLREGDLVFFAIDGRTISHVGIAVAADRFVHAPSSRGVVREESLSVAYWQARFAAARRVVQGTDPGTRPTS
jgi:cell wall-associated NlpC family hydrolase